MVIYHNTIEKSSQTACDYSVFVCAAENLLLLCSVFYTFSLDKSPEKLYVIHLNPVQWKRGRKKIVIPGRIRLLCSEFWRFRCNGACALIPEDFAKVMKKLQRMKAAVSED